MKITPLRNSVQNTSSDFLNLLMVFRSQFTSTYFLYLSTAITVRYSRERGQSSKDNSYVELLVKPNSGRAIKP